MKITIQFALQNSAILILPTIRCRMEQERSMRSPCSHVTSLQLGFQSICIDCMVSLTFHYVFRQESSKLPLWYVQNNTLSFWSAFLCKAVQGEVCPRVMHDQKKKKKKKKKIYVLVRHFPSIDLCNVLFSKQREGSDIFVTIISAQEDTFKQYTGSDSAAKQSS